MSNEIKTLDSDNKTKMIYQAGVRWDIVRKEME